MAAAIVAAANEKHLQLANGTDFTYGLGKGVEGIVEGKRIAVGNLYFLNGIGIFASSKPPDGVAPASATQIGVAIDGHYAGSLEIVDAIKPMTPAAIRSLQAEGLRIVMLTGDATAVAKSIAEQLGITEFEAEVLPKGKLDVIRKLQQQGRVVAMAGDGINDAPALAQANVGIAMGTGTDVAMESGGITLVKGDLTGILRARKLSQATMRNIRQNLFFAFIYNALGVPIAAGVLYPIFGWLLSPIFAAAAMSFSSVSVITNALRLRRVKL